jgi:hypothetical protein
MPTARHRIVQTVQNGLVLYFTFDEGSGNPFDWSGQANDGVNNGATYVTGKYGDALSFDGSDDYINVSDSSILNPNYGSGSCWINITNGSTTEFAIFNKAYSFRFSILYSGITNIYYLQIVLWFANSNYKAVTSNTYFSTGSWIFVVWTFDGTNVCLYINGQKDSSSTTVSTTTLANSSGGSLQVGVWVSNQQWFNGSIDEVRYYNRALTQAEITTLYNGGICSEGLGSADSFSKSKSILRSFAEALGTKDLVSRYHSLKRTIVEGFGSLDLVSKTKSLKRIFTEALASVDSRSRIAIRFRTFTEGFGAKDILAKSKSIYRIFTEAMGTADKLLKSHAMYRVFIEKLGTIPQAQWFFTHIGIYSKYFHKEHPRQKIQNDSK